ncbi:alpha/beta fold hydrolase [Skermania piniformis]|uniref:Alpha/beta hydrolase n=1 Tax=Skermania pinensis TaxID=39122 RepID=A0ABX8SF51_9ACTN|nr:alpha/beta fold hydrolase [Skermania piniformis]QXQ15557.1 alpha/beta hydrolase [Skermania piniformis]
MTTEHRTVPAPGADLGYDVHGDLSAGVPLFMFGSPMEASEFAELAAQFADLPVITYDPRGTGRSRRTDAADRTTTAEHADDLRRILADLAVPAIDLFASSGGAVNALALLGSTAPAVRTAVLHEPPIAEYLPDRDVVSATTRALSELYRTAGFGAAMAKFIDMVARSGPLPDSYPTEPGPDPAMFGLPAVGDGDALFVLNRDTTAFVPDLEALRAGPARLVIGYGAVSGEQLPGRAARALADRLGSAATEFPGHHGGFAAPDRGGDPVAFAARLRNVLGLPTIDGDR